MVIEVEFTVKVKAQVLKEITGPPIDIRLMKGLGGYQALIK